MIGKLPYGAVIKEPQYRFIRITPETKKIQMWCSSYLDRIENFASYTWGLGD